jgi:hypothetical protein
MSASGKGAGEELREKASIGWGVIVLFHGATLWFTGTAGQRWEERKTRQFLERERSRRGPQPPQPRAS